MQVARGGRATAAAIGHRRRARVNRRGDRNQRRDGPVAAPPRPRRRRPVGAPRRSRPAAAKAAGAAVPADARTGRAGAPGGTRGSAAAQAAVGRRRRRTKPSAARPESEERRRRRHRDRRDPHHGGAVDAEAVVGAVVEHLDRQRRDRLVEQDRHQLDVAVGEPAVAAEDRRVERVADLHRELAADVGGVDQEEGKRVELRAGVDVPAHAVVVVAVDPVAGDQPGRAVGVVAAPGHRVVAADLDAGAAVDRRLAGARAHIGDGAEAADPRVLRVGGAALAVPGLLVLEGLDVAALQRVAGQAVAARLLRRASCGAVELTQAEVGDRRLRDRRGQGQRGRENTRPKAYRNQVKHRLIPYKRALRFTGPPGIVSISIKVKMAPVAWRQRAGVRARRKLGGGRSAGTPGDEKRRGSRPKRAEGRLAGVAPARAVVNRLKTLTRP